MKPICSLIIKCGNIKQGLKLFTKKKKTKKTQK